MSTHIVNARIDALFKQGGVVDAQALRPVLVAATKSARGRTDGVSNAEGRSLADLWARAQKLENPAEVPAEAANALVLVGEAVRVMNDFFVQHGLPYGKNQGPMRARIEALLGDVDLGPPLARPPRTGSLQPLRLQDHDGARRDAYLDIVRRQFYVRVGAGYHGPFALVSQ